MHYPTLVAILSVLVYQLRLDVSAGPGNATIADLTLTDANRNRLMSWPEKGNGTVLDAEAGAAASWDRGVTRPWIGPAFWANPMMDWRLNRGRVECHTPGLHHDVHWMTHSLRPGDGFLRMRVRCGLSPKSTGAAFIGFKFGITGHDPSDYRANLFRSQGIPAGVTPAGHLLIGKTQASHVVPAAVLSDMTLTLNVDYRGVQATCRLTVEHDGDRFAEFEHMLSIPSLKGNLALTCECLGSQTASATGWFRSWRISGSKVAVHPDRTFGPILWTQYTLSERVLKLMAHLAPLGEPERRQVRLDVKRGQQWQTVQTSPWDPLSRTALFRVADWNDGRDIPYRVRYVDDGISAPETWDWYGVIRQDPQARDQVALAVFTGLGDAAFPNTDLLATVHKHDPDILFFSGDQIYERNGGYGPVPNATRADVARATLNYLPKLWLWGWSFRDLLRDRPAIVTTDDHDVYSNDLWGRSGRARMTGNRCTGGYSGHPDWVNMAEYTQMGHLPDPVDPAPEKNGIQVHFTQVKYGGIGFAVLEDRKFKSAPSAVLARPIGHKNMANLESITGARFEAQELDRPGLTLLGDRQLAFLKRWTGDWDGITMKAVLSASPFVCCHRAYGNMIADLDSNGWPQSACRRALRLIRENRAVMVHGDLHLAVLLQHGIDAFRDGPWSYCCPSAAATSRRVWFPLRPGSQWDPDTPVELGDHFDGLGNRMTLWAVANPGSEFEKTYRQPDGSILDDTKLAGSGFGILRFDKPNRTVTFESWPIYDAETSLADQRQHTGWPRTITVTD